MSNKVEPAETGRPILEPQQGGARLYYRPEPPRDVPLGIGDVLGFLRRRTFLISSISLIVLALVAAWTYRLPRRYESSVSFLVDTRGRGASDALALLDRLGSGQSAETESELLVGRGVVEPVVDSLDLHLGFVAGYEVPPGEVFTFVEAGPDAESGLYRIAHRGDNYVVRRDETGVQLASAAPGEVLEFANIRLGVPESGLETSVLEIHPFAQAVQSTSGPPW